MAVLTIRRLDDGVKQRLRLRAAARGISVEEAARQLLGESVAAGPSEPTVPPPQVPQPARGSRRGAKSAGASLAMGKPQGSLAGKTILLVISGGIAAYKALDLVRRLRERGASVRAVMTKAAEAFVTPLSVGALTGGKVFTELFDRDDEHDVGHVRLAREADLIVVAPATADLMARIATGLAPDLASTILLAASVPILVAPAMNPAMWAHAATLRNVATLRKDGVHFVGPGSGEMAETGEAGIGRMAEPLEIVAAAQALLASPSEGPLRGLRVLVTAGPTHEPIDPVRYIANRSSGRQGYSIAAAASAAGAAVILVTGPTNIPPPDGVEVVRVETALEMLAATERALPVDIAIMSAAVADWRPAVTRGSKWKKKDGSPAELKLATNPDILATIAKLKRNRPRLVIGFAAETENVAANAREKLRSKGCDWIVANDVSAAGGAMGGTDNEIQLVTADGIEAWPRMPKEAVAGRLIEAIAKTPEFRPQAAE